MFKVRNVSFSYKDKVILDDINFSIEKGKFLSIIGPNGSGKTTLLNLLTGYLEKKSGSIEFLDKEIRNYSVEELSKNFAIISQNEDIKFPFTCLEIVMMGRNPFRERMKKLSEKDLDIVYKAMKITDTLKFSDSLITQISGGEFQRVILARALTQKPNILFLDEAFSAMDISQRIKALKIIKNLVIKEELTVVSIIHDLNLAYMFSDEVCVLKEGKLVALGSPNNIMTTEFINEVFDINVDRIENKGFLIMV
ncbi:ABC transporter ATP-binding protein [Tepidibacter formicigenes]|jgi:iron complex transport system ATP-binding protein|uniref:Iron complex transport system ATP-binding protein n=1 Tax=Tepidibacter formicigenes DSM 15518 TaxID=1123349 RepID=A0A1M6S7G3_9FIRM|nr:ABC transporter ATP-binding protein [Tepidibacter formicigenes]SHK40488.1 iron complex transport system ATP-binding protein [Tepidibacter formicigenes DSM 15518]